MLRIEKVFIQGFKSFSDPTELVFDEEGITAVVGPNGCGKSNIADAISWVIGEQRAKALRGGKMEDVIFQGSRNRAASGMAEVLLQMVVRETFEIRSEAEKGTGDEADPPEQAELAAGSAPPPDSGAVERKKLRRVAGQAMSRVFEEGERVTVARRLYRTGESEYEMNGRACRLRDIQDLFAGTGLGGAHYAIIEQGRIGQVLSAKPLDRRALIEEAAGISKFKLRQHAAELKLEAARQNLSRITDILAEIERQQNSLKRQAARARRYRRLREECRDLMRAVFVADYRGGTRRLAEFEAHLGAVSGRESEALARIVNLESEFAGASRGARAAEESLDALRQRSATADLDAERLRQQKAYLAEQLENLGSRGAQLARERASISERNEFIEQETSRLREQLAQLERELDAEGAALAAAEQLHRGQLDQEAAAEQRLEEARQEVYRQATHLERWRQLRRQFGEAVERNQGQMRGLAAERERALAQSARADEERAALGARLAESAGREQTLASRLADLATVLDARRRESGESQAALAALHRDLTATEHRLKSLMELDERRAYFSEAVQTVMHRSRGNGGVPAAPPARQFDTLGTLADFVCVAPEHEAMIEAGLRDELQYIVVPTFDDALGAIDFLKAEGRGRATFLVLGRRGSDLPEAPGLAGEPAATNGHRGPLLSLLGLRPDLTEAFGRALPALARAVIVDDAAEAVSASGRMASENGNGKAAIFLARSGERAVAGRLLAGGSSAETGAGVLALKREIGELDRRYGTLAGEAATAESGLRELGAEIERLEGERASLDHDLRQTEQQAAVEREQWQQCERDRDRAATYLRVVEQEAGQVEQERADHESKLRHATAETEGAEREHSAAELRVAAAHAELADLRRVAEHRIEGLSRGRAEFAARAERRRGLQNDLRRLDSEADDLHNRLNRSRLEALAADEEAETLQSTLAAAAAELERLTAQQDSLSGELAERAAALSAARERLENLDGGLRAAREAAMQAREERAQIEVERARLLTNLEHLMHTCHQELGQQITELCAAAAAAAAAPEADRRPLLETADGAGPGDEPADEPPDDLEDEGRQISFWTVPEEFDVAEAKARLDELRAKIEALGPVNMMALEELEQVGERLHFLGAQKADLDRAIADTQAAIAEIKRRSRERFEEAFAVINVHFMQMFQELFGGGRGEMRLIDESDVLESGIEIIAQPPGKRLQNVLLLSGGEKAMAALSLVLAIFRYRPSPFCLLDEVDAPLDEVNIGRFADKVIELSRQTQFMIITHSKRTMEAAQTLYGVTMEDPGVSRLVSVRLTSAAS